MDALSSPIAAEYERRLAAMTPAERMARSAALLAWAREVTARRIVAERGPMSPERLRWEVALEHYGDHPVMRMLIERRLAHVPG